MRTTTPSDMMNTKLYADKLNQLRGAKNKLDDQHRPTSNSDFMHDDFISINRRKPTPKQPILICDKNGNVYEAQFTGITFKSDDGKIINNIISWRPRAIRCSKCGSVPVLKTTKRGYDIFTCSNSTDGCENAKPTPEILSCAANGKFEAINKWNDLMLKQLDGRR